MKILVTGAHFTPAVAVIEELKKEKDINIIYVGRKSTQEGDNTQSIESKVLPSLGIKFIPIIAGRLQRSFTIYTILSLLKIPIGFIQALYIILSEKPDVILSFGGYLSVPPVLSGWLFSIPIIVHEQTLVSGLANKIGFLFASKIALSFEQNIKFKKPAVITGNPLRKEILNPPKLIDPEIKMIIDTARKKNLPLILITGGNQGSHIINLAVEKRLSKLTKMACVIHITGSSKFGDYERLKEIEDDCYLVKKWVGRDFGNLLKKADLVVCRGGINTLMEIAFFGSPALVIPLPLFYQNEQMQNAQFFKNLGMVKILPQSQLSADSLILSIKSMLDGIDQLNKNAQNARKVIILDAAKRLSLETILLVKS